MKCLKSSGKSSSKPTKAKKDNTYWYGKGYEQGYFDGHMDLSIGIDNLRKEVFEKHLVRKGKVGC